MPKKVFRIGSVQMACLKKYPPSIDTPGDVVHSTKVTLPSLFLGGWTRLRGHLVRMYMVLNTMTLHHQKRTNGSARTSPPSRYFPPLELF